MYNPIVISHRGGAQPHQQENTLEAFTQSIHLGVHMIEFDVRRTKDNQLIVYHDKKIHHKAISEQTYEEICIYTHKQGFTPPLFKDVLFHHRHEEIFLDIELKEHGYEKTVLKMISKYYPKGKFVIKSFDPRVIYKIKKIDPSITTGLLIGRKGMPLTNIIHQLFPQRIFYKSQADFIAIHYQFTTFFTFRFLKLLSAPIYVWTVNSRRQMKRLLEMKVDGIITDRPDIAMKLLTKSRL